MPGNAEAVLDMLLAHLPASLQYDCHVHEATDAARGLNRREAMALMSHALLPAMSCKLVLYLRKCLPLLQNGLAERVQKSRKQIKERKNRTKKIRGTKKNAGAWNSRSCRISCWAILGQQHRQPTRVMKREPQGVLRASCSLCTDARSMLRGTASWCPSAHRALGCWQTTLVPHAAAMKLLTLPSGVLLLVHPLLPIC